MLVRIEKTEDFDLEITGTYCPGTEGGEAACIADLKVWLWLGRQYIDITGALSVDTYRRYADSVMERAAARRTD
jgi:hypothetical protein